MAFVMLFFLVPASAFAVVPFSQSILTCSRASNACELVVVRGPGLLRSTRTFELSALKRGFVDEHVDDEGDRLSGIALEVQGATMVVDGWSNVNGAAKAEWTDDVNRFLKDSTRNEYTIEYGSTWPSYILSFIIVLIFVAWLRARTRFVIDPVHRVFRIEERIFRTSVEDLPIDHIDVAIIHQKVDEENTTLECVALRLTDGTIKPIAQYSAVEHNDKVQLMAKINDALENVRAN